MSLDRVARLKDALLSVRGLPAEERAAVLARLCGDDVELRREVEGLLAYDVATKSVIGAVGAPLAALPEPERSPDAIGPYRIVEVLGAGGMGVVYRAEQTTPIRREVALKLIRPGLGSARVVARFESERQALALMDHPGIARVLDAGTSPEGRPFFVMELVRGVPITDFCQAQALGVEARLQLFIAVCQAVQHAHQKGIIHRDLKPTNVLITLQDGLPVPKVIDFGIAKAVDPLAEDAALTQEGVFMGTPHYMSPEQAGVVTGGVDTRTDVYSLGALLYELLTGRPPHDFRDYSLGEIHRVLGEEVPVRPSQAATARPDATLSRHMPTQTLPGESQPAAREEVQARQPRRLRRRLAGDLDNIVMMALHKDRERRYASVDQLAEDVRRHLRALPVRARAETWGYRASRFARRHRVGVAVAATAAALLAAFGVSLGVQSARVARERDRALAAESQAREQAARAATEARTARQVSEFLVELFGVSNPDESRGASITAREILDRGSRRIKEEMAEEPEVRARLMHVMGEVYHSLGLYDEALPLVERALGLRREILGRAHPDVAATLDLMGTLAHDHGQLEKSEAFYREALEMRRRLVARSLEVAESANHLAITLQARGDLRGAEPLYREALELNRELRGEDDVEVAWNRNSLGWALHAQGKYDEAEPLYRQALAVQRRRLGEVHQDVAHTLNNLAGVRMHKGDYGEAESLFRDALRVYTTLYRGEHAAVARGRYNVGRVLRLRGRYEEAETLTRQALAINRKLLGPAHPFVANTLSGLGEVLHDRGRQREADAALREALAMRLRLLGPEHPAVAASWSALCRLLLETGHLTAAEDLARRALAVRRARLGPEHPEVAGSLEDLGRILRARGRLQEAEEPLRAALQLRRKLLPAGHPEIGSSLLELGGLLEEKGEPAGAEPLLTEGLGIRRPLLPAGRRQLLAAEKALEGCRRARGL